MIKIVLSRKLGELRRTQADLARATGIRPTTISELYNELAELFIRRKAGNGYCFFGFFQIFCSAFRSSGSYNNPMILYTIIVNISLQKQKNRRAFWLCGCSALKSPYHL